MTNFLWIFVKLEKVLIGKECQGRVLGFAVHKGFAHKDLIMHMDFFVLKAIAVQMDLDLLAFMNNLPV